MKNNIGFTMHNWIKDLYPFNRSLTGEGNRKTLRYIKKIIPQLSIKKVRSGTKCFDWKVPAEWNISEGYIENQNNKKIIDFKNNNLHVIGYSKPIDKWINFNELNEHLYSLPKMKDAIPYVTSYYEKRWGFCIKHNERLKLNKKNKYHVVIKSSFSNGNMNYGELIIKGKTKKEILLSTYICHPSMANNELSGIAVTTFLSKWLLQNKNHFSYRILFLPETIGSIYYLSRNYKKMKKNIVAGYVVTCVGDNRCYSYLPSKIENSLSNRAAKYILKRIDKKFKLYSFLDRGSDERQYCSPLINLPIGSIMRSKYDEYPEYHTSKDNMKLISPSGLRGGFVAIRKTIELIEKNFIYVNTFKCEPQLGKRNFYPTLSLPNSTEKIAPSMNLLAYADGKNDLLEISKIIKVDFEDCYHIAENLCNLGVLKKV